MKVLVAHPQRLYADALTCVLSSTDGITVVGTVVDPDELIKQTLYVTPDVVALSAYYVDPLDPKIITSLKEARGSCGILIVSEGSGTDEFVGYLKAGASAYVGTDSVSSQFVDAVRKVTMGEIFVCGVDRTYLEGKRVVDGDGKSPEGRTAALGTLTPREKEVLQLLSRGFSNRQIAEELYLSEHTIRTHVQNLRTKLNVRSKFQAAVLAMQASGAQKLTPRMQF